MRLSVIIGTFEVIINDPDKSGQVALPENCSTV